MLANGRVPHLFHLVGIRWVAAGVKGARQVVRRDIQHPPGYVLELCAGPGHRLQGGFVLVKLIFGHHPVAVLHPDVDPLMRRHITKMEIRLRLISVVLIAGGYAFALARIVRGGPHHAAPLRVPCVRHASNVLHHRVLHARIVGTAPNHARTLPP